MVVVVNVRKNLVGERFGRLVVVKQADDYIDGNEKHYAQWECKCDCGNTITVLGSNLGRSTLSCGCIKDEQRHARFQDLTGQRFNRLTVIKQSDDYYINPASGARVAKWVCRCDCGEIITCTSTSLKDGHRQSCGCQKADKRLNDLTGIQFGHLIVTERAPSHVTPNGSIKTMWKCRCTNCGNEDAIVSSEHLLSGDTKSCGCLRSENSKQMLTTHNGSNDRLYGVWCAMKRRCYDKNNIRYNHYGGRGICVCDDWNNSYEVFREWALENGYDANAKRGECTIERVDVNGNYCPENCKWATMKVQANNTRFNRFITINGDTKTVSQWADTMNVSTRLIYTRLYKGWSDYDAVMTPKGERRGNYGSQV